MKQKSLWVTAVAVLVLMWSPARVHAQIPTTGAGADTAQARRALEARLGRRVSQGEIMEMLRQSGMTREQVRLRLRQAGYDPDMANAYFDAMERGGELPAGAPSGSFVDALNRIGLAGRLGPLAGDTAGFHTDTLDLDFDLPPDTLDPAEMRVFGVRTFRSAGTQFRPNLHGPVDAGYRLGPGDELILVLTGDVEAAYALDVSREGFLFIPDVGQVSVNGLTLAQLEDQLYSRLGRVYSGVRRSGATTRFQISLGRLRVNQVVITGDVTRPGAYQVTSAAGLFHALYQAGGPTAQGSFRRVEVHRGGRIAHEVDLYDFLVRGNAVGDIRLEHNDRIFIPPAGTQVQIDGAVRRSAIYELKPGEGLRDLIAFTGGLRSDALVRRVQIDRIVPPAEQRPGFYRTLVDVDLNRLATAAPDVALSDGDLVHVFAVSDVRRNRIWVEGEVRNPGVYEWASGSTLWSALERADGLGEFAYTPRAHVYRLIENDGTRRLIQASLERDEAGRPLHDLPLADNDSIVVLSRRELLTPAMVTIHGYVKEPDTYPLARGMTLQDLILAAGGFTDGAYLLEAEISRMPDALQRTDTTAYVVRVPLGAGSNGSDNGVAEPDVLPRWLPRADELRLAHGDRVFIRLAPGYEPVREVRVTGQVLMPGRYVLATRQDRVSDVMQRAGGVTGEAYVPGMHVIRDGHVVAADLQRALRDPRDINNILLQAGDSIHVPTYDGMVLVTGAVNFESRVLYVPGRNMEYYVTQAGGYTEDADRRRATVAYPNGERNGVRSSWLGTRTPRIMPGSRIIVPAKAESTRGTNWDIVIARTAALLSAGATAIIAITQLR